MIMVLVVHWMSQFKCLFNTHKGGKVSQIISGYQHITKNSSFNLNLKNIPIVHAHIIATGNVTINLINFSKTILLCLKTEQNEVGGWTFTFPGSQFEFETSVPTQSTAANAKDTWLFGFDGNKMHQHSFAKDVK